MNFAFEKDCNGLKDRSEDAFLIRKRSSKLRKTLKSLVTASSTIFHIRKLKTMKYPIKTQSDEVLDFFKLERTVFHSGS